MPVEMQHAVLVHDFISFLGKAGLMEPLLGGFITLSKIIGRELPGEGFGGFLVIVLKAQQPLRQGHFVGNRKDRVAKQLEGDRNE